VRDFFYEETYCEVTFLGCETMIYPEEIFFFAKAIYL